MLQRLFRANPNRLARAQSRMLSAVSQSISEGICACTRAAAWLALSVTFATASANPPLIGQWSVSPPSDPFAHAQTPQTPSTQRVEDIPWKDRTWEQQFIHSSYDDEFTFKHHKGFYKDPFIWAVSAQFAEEFGMPERWIDPGLKGALAVAWRTTNIGQERCGDSGNPDICRPAFTCQMDIYVDRKANIPWNFDDVERDFNWHGVSSLDYVPRRLPAPVRVRYTRDMQGKFGSKGNPFYKTSLEYKNGGSSQGFLVAYFDRSFTKSISLLGFRSACPEPTARMGSASLHFFTNAERERTRGFAKTYTHSIELSEAYMRRITEAFLPADAANKERSTAYQEVKRRFFPK